MTEEFEVEVDHLLIRGLRRPGCGPRCLALHGWLDNCGSFTTLQHHLPDWDFLAVDFPGHGRSQWLPAAATYHFVDTVARVVQLVRHWAQPRLVLLGHSMGGAVATLAASLVPDQVEALIILDALGPISTPDEEARELFLKALQSRQPYQRRYYSTRQAAIGRVCSGGHSLEAAEHLVARSLLQCEQGYFFSFDPRLKEVSRARYTETQLKNFLTAIPCPVQVQSYSQGLLPRFPPARQRFEWLPRGWWVDLEGGHHLHLEQPEPVARAILDFYLQTSSS